MARAGKPFKGFRMQSQVTSVNDNKFCSQKLRTLDGKHHRQMGGGQSLFFRHFSAHRGESLARLCGLVKDRIGFGGEWQILKLTETHCAVVGNDLKS
jgi:hypothetical protein